nr:MAG TPA: stage V sporulation protein T [Caudoviricetes sp.]
MRATGIIRRIDDLGRVIIPKEIRRTLRIREGDPLEIFLENNAIVFQKYQPLAMNDDIINTTFAMLKTSSLDRFALYDTDYILRSWPNVKESFPSTSDDWREKRRPFMLQDNVIYPILVDGELFGYLLGKGENAENILKIVATYIRTQLELD